MDTVYYQLIWLGRKNIKKIITENCLVKKVNTYIVMPSNVCKIKLNCV